MPIIAQLVPIYQEILALPDVVGGPVLSWGVTKINIPDFFRKPWAELSIREKTDKAVPLARCIICRGNCPTDSTIPTWARCFELAECKRSISSIGTIAARRCGST